MLALPRWLHLLALLTCALVPCAAPAEARALKIYVLGDSDSHTYRDAVNGVARGGAHHDVAYQWTEIWQILRPAEVDMGPRGIWGTNAKFASLRAWLGLSYRVKAKADYRYNFAFSGATCRKLFHYPYQVRGLTSLLEHASADQPGLVVIRIGINDFGQLSHLHRWAAGDVVEANTRVDACLADIGQAISAVRALRPDMRFALVGTSHDYNGIGVEADTFDARAIERIQDVYGRFETGLQALAADADVAFVSGAAHAARIWGDRFAGTRIEAATIDGSRPLINGVGDEPYHRTLADGHASTITNGFWLQDFITAVNAQLGLGFSQIETREFFRLADPNGAHGIYRDAS